MKLTKSQLKEFIDEEFDQMDEAPGAADVRSEQNKAVQAVMSLLTSPGVVSKIMGTGGMGDRRLGELGKQGWIVNNVDRTKAEMGEISIDLQDARGSGKSTRVTLTAKANPRKRVVKSKRNVPTDYSPESDLYKL
jgi:hypothetical protein